ncbi:hypothetical protein [Eubacterium aggregans]|uniref:hypothetical protein n=1 Tax=Eubacterium aggregans TaxID=81409 RepID=UPI003F3137BB
MPDLTLWKKNSCSTQAMCKLAKLRVVQRLIQFSDLTVAEGEVLANKAGLSLCQEKRGFEEILVGHRGKFCDLLKEAAISERMFQYYCSGKVPTKQALLALVIALDLPVEEIEQTLCQYGYCLSRSLPNDQIIRFYLENSQVRGGMLLSCINEVLE